MADWNDASRDQLRENLQMVVRGELRFGKRSFEEILELLRESYIEEDAPKYEWDEWKEFAHEELEQAALAYALEQQGWPDETDCDRLNRVEETLRGREIMLWQGSPCCDSCSLSEMPERFEMLEREHPGFTDRARGYAFFHDHNIPESLADGPELSVYLAYGWFAPEDSEVDPEIYKKNALGIAREVCSCLREQGFKVDWDGSFDHKIGLRLIWQQRAVPGN